MGFSQLAGLALAGLAVGAMAEDLLFYDNMTYVEYTRATTVLNYTGILLPPPRSPSSADPFVIIARIATPDQWNTMTAADFALYKAIIIPDPSCGNLSRIDFLENTKAAWSPAIQGNIIIVGTDPSYHSQTEPGAITLIDDGVRFAASGNGTGLYFSLSCYYESVAFASVTSLSLFGVINVRGELACYNNAHLVADSTALGMLTDAALSNWSCSVHEAFTEYPTTGFYAMEPLAIARDATGTGVKAFADGSSGIPYILVKGATPARCGNGIWEPTLDEECDDGPLNGTPSSGCSLSCKCLTGSISPGVCAPFSVSTISSRSPTNSLRFPTLMTTTGTSTVRTSLSSSSSTGATSRYANATITINILKSSTNRFSKLLSTLIVFRVVFEFRKQFGNYLAG